MWRYLQGFRAHESSKPHYRIPYSMHTALMFFRIHLLMDNSLQGKATQHNRKTTQLDCEAVIFQRNTGWLKLTTIAFKVMLLPINLLRQLNHTCKSRQATKACCICVLRLLNPSALHVYTYKIKLPFQTRVCSGLTSI